MEPGCDPGDDEGCRGGCVDGLHGRKGVGEYTDFAARVVAAVRCFGDVVFIEHELMEVDTWSTCKFYHGLGLGKSVWEQGFGDS